MHLLKNPATSAELLLASSISSLKYSEISKQSTSDRYIFFTSTAIMEISV